MLISQKRTIQRIVVGRYVCSQRYVQRTANSRMLITDSSVRIAGIPTDGNLFPTLITGVVKGGYRNSLVEL